MSYGNEQTKGTGKFFSIRTRTDAKGHKNACLALSVDKDTPGAEPVYNKEGKPVTDKDGNQRYRLTFSFVEGHIVDFLTKQVEYNGKPIDLLDVVLFDGTDRLTISMQRGDRYWVNFMSRLPAVDLSKPVRMSPYNFTDDKGSQFTGLSMIQDGKKVYPVYTKENNWGDMPKAKTLEFGGKTLWDFSERDNWLEVRGIHAAAKELEKMAQESPLADQHTSMPQAARAPVPPPATGQAHVPAPPRTDVPMPTVADMPPMPDEDDLPF